MTQPRNPILEQQLYEPPKPEPIRYAIYTRQSVETLTDFSSCDAQFQTCQDFAHALAAPGTEWCGQRFDDQGYSGATLDRPGMRKLRKVIDLGGVSLVYAVALDRLTRNMGDAVVLIDEFENAGVEVRFAEPRTYLKRNGRHLAGKVIRFTSAPESVSQNREAF